MLITPSRIRVPEDVLTGLRQRIARVRWPQPAPGPAWSQGTDLAFLQGMLADWATFDWRAAEERINGGYDQFVAEVSGLRVHYVHHRVPGADGPPVILTHGWPSSFVEMLPLVDRLRDPAAYGIDAPARDVVAVSLPGYPFSERPAGEHTLRDTARVWHDLMTGLGYPRYLAAGSDFGSGVSTFLALDHPDTVAGLYLTDLELDPVLDPAVDPTPLSPAERAYLDAGERWSLTEGGYHAIASTRPQTLAYGLTDSPAGLAAWLLEKWRAWSDCAEGRVPRVSREFLLTTLTLYWATGCVGSTLRDFHDNRQVQEGMTVGDRVLAPTAFGRFGNGLDDLRPPPPEFVGRLCRVVRSTVHDEGGHFPAVEVPDRLAADMLAFFAEC
ncbi:hypothetical protein CcI156_15125 [Frankia sp. CcI156]|uniref:Epoxide hydrolase-like n=2 Tax=Frankia TaxID=1854 RepID=Q2J7N1_FRACC|nr:MULTISPECIES: epoxide hydrolase family protein [Frankia]ABD12711.1 Epoxide hydrolase-like [Frankia casuarinae]ETA03197.1 putative hydrolase or acyltransferase of alpha/beta superfamily [Frankia sp. CcI6]EYT91002.1 putative hydrolase or acyltransferase of alpha/beta superfamily [Frankia casuarinae]OHV51281.1 hypothetical protein CgIS1_19080 [Frankia sp. CgIS1]ONH24703.1 hypothetical protein CcI156_15125 [Frankia sp. CcI156]